MRLIILSATLLLSACAGGTQNATEELPTVEDVRILSIVNDGERNAGRFNLRTSVEEENQNQIASARVESWRQNYQILSYSAGEYSISSGTTCQTLICVNHTDDEYLFIGRDNNLLNLHVIVSEVGMATLSDGSEIFVIVNGGIEPNILLVPKNRGLSTAAVAEIFDRLAE